MINGYFSFNPSDLQINDADYSNLLNVTAFSESSTEEYNDRFVRFNILHHNRLPENRKDRFLIKDELLFILCGHLYPYKEDCLELISEAYENTGIDFIKNLEGDFALIIIDKGKKESFFIKNQLGTVPLSLAEKNGKWYFSSDTMGLAKALYHDDGIDTTYVQSRFFEYQGNYTHLPVSYVQKVLPGHYVHTTVDRSTQIKYWKPELINADSSIDFKSAVAHLHELLNTSLQNRVDLNYSAGAHISGGLDSSLIASMTRNAYAKQEYFNAFTWSPSYEVDTSTLPFDERKNIEEQAQKSNFEVHYTNSTVEDYHAFVNEWRCPSEFIFEHQVVQNAIENNTNLIFSGWGGDEFIGVRDEGLYMELFKKGKFRSFFGINRQKGLTKQIMHVINNFILPTRRKKYMFQKMSDGMFNYMKPGFFSNSNPEYHCASLSSKTGYQLGLINYYHIAERCEDWYILGQRNGVEYRYPLLDLNIVEYCLSIPAEMFASNEIDRPLIRELAKYHLTDSIRLLVKQSDPVLMRNALRIQKEAVLQYYKEINEFRANPYLNFIDFEKLENDFVNGINLKKVYHTLHFVKAAHMFVANFNHNL